MKNLSLAQFLKTQDNKEKIIEILQKDPFNLKVSQEGPFYLFKYDQRKSDFDYRLVREARGIIFQDTGNGFKLVRRSFDKFFNIQESRAAEIDFSTATVFEKLDGSLISLWWNDVDNKWMVSTNGTIDAFKTYFGPSGKSFGDLFIEALTDPFKDYSRLWEDFHKGTTTLLDKQVCYSFELTSPDNKIVVPYSKASLTLLKLHNIQFDCELSLSILESIPWTMSHLPPMPKIFSFNSLQDTLKASQRLPYSEEGYVVLDGKGDRVKIKSPAYVMAHHVRGEGVINTEKVLYLIMENEVDEFVALFPEHTEFIEKTRIRLKSVMTGFIEAEKEFDEVSKDISRKEFAEWAKTKQPYTAFLFKLHDGNENVSTFLDKMPLKKLTELVDNHPN